MESRKKRKMSNQQAASSSSSSPIEYHQGPPEIESLYLATKFVDVHFLFDSDDGTIIRVPAHKLLLANVSDVFEAMFYGELKETGDIRVTDASDTVFKEFLQFFYLSNVELTAEHVLGVLYLGEKYDVKKCVGTCLGILKNGVKNENVCTTLAAAILYDRKELIKACEKYILVNTATVLKSAEFLECNENVLAHILEMKLLSCSEVDVFEACMAWVMARSKTNTLTKSMVEKHMGDLYYKIRFMSMTIQEFFALETKYNAVLSCDLSTIARIITKSDVVDAHKFNTTLRQIEWNDDKIIKCEHEDQSIGSTFDFYGPVKFNTFFSTNEPLLLGSFVCAEIDGLYGTIDVRITEARTLYAANAKILYDEKVETTSLSLPILIRPGFFYNLSIEYPFVEERRYEIPKLEGEKQLDSDIIIQFHGMKTGPVSVLNFNKI